MRKEFLIKFEGNEEDLLEIFSFRLRTWLETGVDNLVQEDTMDDWVTVEVEEID